MFLQVLPRDGSEPERQLREVYASHVTLYCVSTKNVSFGTKSFIFQFAIQEYKDLDIQNYNFACYFLWVFSLVSHTEGETYAEGVREQVMRRLSGLRRDEVTGEWR